MTAVSMDPRLRARRAHVLRQRGRRRLRTLLALVALIAVAAAGYGLIHSPMLEVDRVVVDGAARVPPEAIVAAAGIEIGSPMTEVDQAAARAAIATLPWVDTVVSRRNWPREVRFEITERQPVAVIDVGDRWLTVDITGRVLEASTTGPPGAAVLGHPSWSVEPGSWVPAEALPAVELMARLPARLAEETIAVRADEGEIWLDLAAGSRVRLGDQRELADKLVSAVTVLARVEMSCADVIDVRVPSAPVLTRRTNCP